MRPSSLSRFSLWRAVDRVTVAAFTVAGITAGALLSVVLADSSPQLVPFAQNWTNASLITVNDDWSGTPGIVGYRGDGLTGGTGTDPQTLLVEGTPVVDVNANQTLPDTFNTGGVTEFAIADPTIALTGSGTADAPYILITLNTTGTTSINVAYNLRDLDGSIDNAVQPVALQYRVGTTGSFTNLPAGFVADATTGPSLATLVTPVSVTLPAAAENQPAVQVRVMTTNAAGNDEWVGIDDISITGATGGPPSLTINDVAQTEGDAGTTTFAFTVSLSAPAGPGGVTFDIATADNTATTADNDYVANSLTGQTILAGNTTFPFNVTVNGDVTAEANQTFFVNITNITGANAGDVQGLGTITNDDFPILPIHTIQGSGAGSAFVGQVVQTTGIVTLLKTTTNNGGPADHFFVQTPDANIDGDPLTSQGLLVFTAGVPTVAVGDEVNITGTIEEFFQMTRLKSVTSVSVLGVGNPLPAPVVLTSAILDPAALPDQPQLEAFEGMRLSAVSLTTVAPTDAFYDADAVLTGVPRPRREPGIEASLAAVPPDPTTAAPDCCVPRWDENPERIVIDTNARAGGSLNPYTTNVVFSNVVGPLDFTFSRYRLVIEAAPTATANITAVPLPAPQPNEFTVANLNIEFFANDATQAAKVSKGIREVMRYPDIIGHEEISNLTDLQGLANQVNNDAVAAGDPNPLYVAQLVPATAAGTQNVGFLVKTSRVTVNSVTQQELPGCVNTTATCYTYINPTTSLPDVLNDRPPLLLDAVVDPTGTPTPVLVVVNHTRSFIDIDADPGAGPRVRAKRKAQAEFLATFLDTLQDNNPGVSVISVGDYNAYEFSDGFTDPIATIKGTPTADDEIVVDASPDSVDPDFVNLMDLVPASERYSFVFEGTPQAIDHILVNQSAAQRVTRIAVAHMNADFPASFETDISRAERGSDHDAPVAYFSLAPVSADLGVTKTASPEPVAAGSNLTYTITATNSGPDAAAGATMTDPLPVGTTFVSLSAPAGWACTTPGVGVHGTISCVHPSLAVGPQLFTLVAKVDLAVPPATTLSNTATVTALTTDSNSLNDSDTALSTTTAACAPISLGPLPNGIVGIGYSGSAAASGGTGPYSYSISSGALPPGLLLNMSGAGAGAVTGTPTATGTFTFGITALDAPATGGCTGVANYTVVIGSAVAPGNLVIREFRARGPAGIHDEYVELVNKTAAPLTLAATDFSAGFGIGGQNVGTCPGGSTQLLASIPNGTVIPAGGFFLAVNPTGYSLANYGGALASTADATWTNDLCDNSGVALFRSSSTLDTTTRLDAAGFVGSTTPYIEGAGIPVPASTGTAEVTYLRNAPGGVIQDTGVNANDFFLGDTSAATFGAVKARLASPGPQNASSEKASGLTFTLADPAKGATVFPNRWRTTTTATTGTYYFRWKVTNNTGAAITKLRIRVANVTTLNSPGYAPAGSQADFRLISSPDVGISVPGAVTALGLAAESPTAPGLDGGYHASAAATLPGGTLANGASVYINVALRYQQAGAYVYFVSGEAK